MSKQADISVKTQTVPSHQKKILRLTSCATLRSWGHL